MRPARCSLPGGGTPARGGGGTPLFPARASRHRHAPDGLHGVLRVQPPDVLVGGGGGQVGEELRQVAAHVRVRAVPDMRVLDLRTAARVTSHIRIHIFIFIFTYSHIQIFTYSHYIASCHRLIAHPRITSVIAREESVSPQPPFRRKASVSASYCPCPPPPVPAAPAAPAAPACPGPACPSARLPGHAPYPRQGQVGPAREPRCQAVRPGQQTLQRGSPPGPLLLRTQSPLAPPVQPNPFPTPPATPPVPHHPRQRPRQSRTCAKAVRTVCTTLEEVQVIVGTMEWPSALVRSEVLMYTTWPVGAGGHGAVFGRVCGGGRARGPRGSAAGRVRGHRRNAV